MGLAQVRPIEKPVRLNLGAGADLRVGWTNVDKFGSQDMMWDLESTPWPWATSTVDEVLMKHVLEHLGATSDKFIAIVKELYRICKHGARIRIIVPHPRHDDFLGDPTHVRPITLDLLTLFAKDQCERWQKLGASNSLLALYHNVDLRVVDHAYGLDDAWAKALADKRATQADVDHAARHYANVVKEIDVTLEVVKPC